MHAILLAMMLVSAPLDPQECIVAGGRALEHHQWQEASMHFNNAIDSGYLNDVNMAISYWNIHIAEVNLGNVDKDMEALLGFIVWCRALDESPWPLMQAWKKKFKLKYKSLLAHIMMQAEWANRNSYSCRSELFSCYVANKGLIRILEKNTFCRGLGVKRVFVPGNKRILRANITCSDDSKETYYFITRN